MPSCPPLFTNFNNTFETNIGGCFDGFWYYPHNLLTNPLTQLVVPSNVAYDYNRNCVTVNGLPVAPNCWGAFSAVPEFATPCSTYNPLKNQTGYAGDAPNSHNVFFDPAACDADVWPMVYPSYGDDSLIITDSQGRALWISAAVSC